MFQSQAGPCLVGGDSVGNMLAHVAAYTRMSLKIFHVLLLQEAATAHCLLPFLSSSQFHVSRSDFPRLLQHDMRFLIHFLEYPIPPPPLSVTFFRVQWISGMERAIIDRKNLRMK